MSAALRKPLAYSASATEKARLTGYGRVCPVMVGAGATFAISVSSFTVVIALISQA